MLNHLLSGILKQDQILALSDIIYYTLAFISVLFTFHLVYGRLIIQGHKKAGLRIFMILVFILSFPAGYFSSRAANMFYYPPEHWSLSAFFSSLLYSNTHTWHSCIVLPALLIVILSKMFAYKLSSTLDAFFLYLPAGLAIGRVGCLLAGCCWGNRIELCLAGRCFHFQNPVPLYSIILNLLLFLFLRGQYEKIYAGENKRASGLITGYYLLLYGSGRFLLEFIRTEPRVFHGLSQAQIVMAAYVLCGLTILTISSAANTRVPR